MKAVVIHAAGDLRLEDVEEPELGPKDVKIRVGAGGICGSDLHYYKYGGFGAVRLREPMILGHEIAGTVLEVGSGIETVTAGQKVAINPSRACGACTFCQEGLQNHCREMRFFGSAMHFPHVQGGFREILTCDAAQAVPIPSHVPLAEAAFAEPLAVCLHSAARAGSLLGKRVLITGSGPIGALTIAAARLAGAAEIVVTDIVDAPLKIARDVGADRTINVATRPEALAAYEQDKGVFDLMFEAAGSSSALLAGLKVVRPGGIIVQVGQGSEATLPMSLIVTKELEIRGTFRFHSEFATAAALIADRRVDVRPLLTDIIAIDEAIRAFDRASDKNHSMKVQLAFA